MYSKFYLLICNIFRERKSSVQSNVSDSDPISYEFSADSLLSDSDKVMSKQWQKNGLKRGRGGVCTLIGNEILVCKFCSGRMGFFYSYQFQT